MWGDIAIAFMIAFMTSFMMTPQTIKLARKLGAVDTPQDERRINRITMPRLGGLAVIAGFIISIAYLLIVMTIEGNINLLQDNYHTKLLGFAVRWFNYLCGVFFWWCQRNKGNCEINCADFGGNRSCQVWLDYWFHWYSID